MKVGKGASLARYREGLGPCFSKALTTSADLFKVKALVKVVHCSMELGTSGRNPSQANSVHPLVDFDIATYFLIDPKHDLVPDLDMRKQIKLFTPQNKL